MYYTFAIRCNIMGVAEEDWLRLGCVGVVAAEVVIKAPDQHAPLWVQAVAFKILDRNRSQHRV